MDGTHETGNAHFFFLPPLAAEAPRTEGEANPDLAPTAALCELDTEAQWCEGEPLHTWARVPGPLEGEIESRQEHYELKLTPAAVGLTAGRSYRITVSVGSETLGWADFQLFRTGRERGDIEAAGHVAVGAHGTTPVRFRIEEGALCDWDQLCREVLLTAEGGTFTVEAEATGTEGGVFIPEDALPREDPDDPDSPPVQVTLIIEVVALSATEKCLDTDLRQFGDCFRFRTDPQIEFTRDVTVAICVGLDDLAFKEGSLIHRQDEHTGVIEALPEAVADFVDCDGSSSIGWLPGATGRLARAGVEALRRLLLPRTLLAGDLGFGGLTKTFSRMAWAEPVELVVVGASAFRGETETTEPDGPAVLVQTQHHHSYPVPDLPLVIQLERADGTIQGPVIVTSDEQGITSVPWTFGRAAGYERMSMTTPTPGSRTMVFQGTALGLASHYTADETTEDAIGGDGLSAAASIGYAAGVFGQAFRFRRAGDSDGYVLSDGHVDLDPSSQLGASLWVWIDPESPATVEQRLLTLGEKFVLRQGASPGPDRTLQFYGAGFDGRVPGALRPGCWNHVAADSDGRAARLYLNGQEVWSEVVDPPAATTGAGVLLSHGGTERLDGLIDDVRLYNRALEASEVVTLYEAGVDTGAAVCSARPAGEGDQLGFMSTRGGSQWDLWLLTLPDTAAERLTNDPGMEDKGVAWSPDGERLAFSRLNFATQTYDIHVLDTSTGEVTNVTATPGEQETWPAWSPDGSRILFTGTTSLFLMNPDGTGRTQLTAGPQSCCGTWSPDGARIAFVTIGDGRDIFVMNADGTDKRNITNSPGDDWEPDWSPRGDEILFRASDNNIYGIAPDGSRRRAITAEASAWNHRPAWSPDGRLIAFATNRTGGWEIFTVTRDALNPVNRTQNEALDLNPFWRPRP